MRLHGGFFLGLAILLLAGAYGLFSSLKSADSTGSKPLPCSDATCAAFAALPPAKVVAPPCPYCNQDPQRWQSLTKVAPPDIGGHTAAVVEGACGNLIYGLHENDHLPPASLTKIVTALVTMDRAQLTDRVPISINGWDLSVDDGSSIMGLEAGMNLSVEELLYGLLLPSGNDAALTLADRFGGKDQFVAAMNQRVGRLGLSNTHFVNPDGRDAAGHYSSAFDMALLGRELMANPTLRKMVGASSFTPNWAGNRLLWNDNYLLQYYPGAEGVKIGYTDGANYTIVSAAQRDGRELFAAVLGTQNLYFDARRLLDWAFTNTKSTCPGGP